MAFSFRRELSKEELEQVQGGAWFVRTDYDIDGETIEIEVIDDESGEVLGTFVNDYHGAYLFAKERGVSLDVLTWPELKKIRDDYKKKNL